jgi:hypothetical protein
MQGIYQVTLSAVVVGSIERVEQGQPHERWLLRYAGGRIERFATFSGAKEAAHHAWGCWAKIKKARS